MVISPNGVVQLLKDIPLGVEQIHQLYFTSISAQNAYFSQHIESSYREVTYVRRERNFIIVPTNSELLYRANYMRFQNSNYSNKWFYAFITQIEYHSPEAAAIYFEIDPFQTWVTDFYFLDCFVEREHTRRFQNGVPVVNTLDEGLNYGLAYETVWEQQYYPPNDVLFFVLTTKNDIRLEKSHPDFWSTTFLGDITTPLHHYLLPVRLGGSGTMRVNGISIAYLSEVIKLLGQSDDLVGNAVSLGIIPDLPFSYTINGNNISSDNLIINNELKIKIPEINYTKSDVLAKTIVNINKYSNFPNYSESKLYMYPYSFIEITDYKGHVLEIHAELIEGQNLNIKSIGSISTEQKTAYIVQNYKGSSNSLENAVINNSINSIPIIDDYTAAYIQGNKNSIISSTATSSLLSAVSATASFATGNIVGGAISTISGISGIFNQMAKLKDIENIPPSISSQGNNAFFDYPNDIKGVFVRKKTITSEYAEKLTGFFKMYGYKVNSVKTPNLDTRERWNYVKTNNAMIKGAIPHDDLEAIKTMFNNGITLWRSSALVGDYSASNNEI